MRTVSATEASRSFAALLDEAEAGETVIITRGGVRVATLGPASAGNGAALIELLRKHPADAEFKADVEAARASAVLDEDAWPES